MRKAVILAIILALVVVGISTVDAKKKAKGKIKLAQKGYVMELEFDGGVKFNVTSKAKSLPVNTYTPKAFKLMKLDKKRKIWSLESYGKFTNGKSTMGPVAEFEIKEGETTELDVGPPLLVRVVVGHRSTKNGQKTISINYRIDGKAGEMYRPAPSVGSKRVPAPLFQITDPKGKILAQGKFSYG